MTAPYYQDDSVTLHHGDCLDVLRELPDNSVDAVITDPPYSLNFMGREWDSLNGREDAGFAYWLAGFIDGEGCFRVQRHERGTYTCTFSINVRRDERATLEAIKRFLSVGTISEHEGSGNANPLCRYAIQDKAGCIRLVQILDKYPLRAKKRLDYEAWAEAVSEWSSMKRGNRWSGPSDWTRMAALKSRIETTRQYVEPPWSGNEFQDWCRLWATECLRILKPGGHLLAFGGSRTWHRLAAAIEDAGFEIRDSIAWLYAQGFPKSMNLPGGLGTALKPAFEPIVVARKPLAGTVAANVLEHGTGALNIDACRVGDEVRHASFTSFAPASGNRLGAPGTQEARRGTQGEPKQYTGRWPTNLVLDEHQAAALDGQSGVSISRVGKPRGAGSGAGWGMTATGAEYADEGGASRFFPVFRYEAKAPTSERPNYFRPSCNCEDSWPTTSPERATGATAQPESSSISKYGNNTTEGHSQTDTRSTTSTRTSSTTHQRICSQSPQPNISESTPVANCETANGSNHAHSVGDSSGSTLTTGISVNGVGRSTGGVDRAISQKWSEKSKCGVCGARARREAHATVKPLDLMRWLVRLVTPVGAVVLEPFAGSGTTAEACVLEDRRCVAIEREAEYLPLIVSRLRKPVQQGLFGLETGA
ncbi:DNA methyltransferase [Mycobacteroides chelonae]|nr:DNA methyltransferase [Mycobacteroides chelonae]